MVRDETADRRGTRRASMHRAHGLPGTLGVTFLGAVLPGAGFIWAGRRHLGLLILLPTLLVATIAGWYLLARWRSVLHAAFDPNRLTIAAVLMLLVLVAWLVMVVATYLTVRPVERPTWETVAGSAFVALLCALLAMPLVIGARYSMVQRDLVTTVFASDPRSATRPLHVAPDDPWGEADRVNVLLLGGDGGIHREGIRTDTVILASVDVHSGDTVLFSLPRNLMDVPFPEDSPLHEAYPNGFQGSGDAGEWMLNAIYRNVPQQHPGILGATDNEGADALKQAVSATLGVPVDYYVLVNLNGFEKIVDAMGGVTVNINQPIPVGGDTDRGIPPERYLEPGPHQHLDGFDALWFARGRYGLDDYNRMERQRCMIKAMVDEADPMTLLRRYQALAEAGKKIVRTDIPQGLLAAFVDLSLKIKDGQLTSVVFVRSDEFSPSDPDFAWVHKTVHKALHPPKPSKSAGQPSAPSSPSESPSTSPNEPAAAKDSCAYHPVS